MTCLDAHEIPAWSFFSVSADEAIATDDLFAQGRDQTLAVDGEVNGGVDATSQQFGDRQGSASPLEDVVRQVNLRQTREAACGGRLRSATTEAADGTELSIERGFEYPQDKILEVIGHGFRLKVGRLESGRQNHRLPERPRITKSIATQTAPRADHLVRPRLRRRWAVAYRG